MWLDDIVEAPSNKKKELAAARAIAAMLLVEYRAYKRQANNAYNSVYGALDDHRASVLSRAYKEAKKIINAATHS